VWYDGNVYVSENNRRLFVFKRLESEVVHAPTLALLTHPAFRRVCCKPCQFELSA
jgi:hypothetical protein